MAQETPMSPEEEEAKIKELEQILNASDAQLAESGGGEMPMPMPEQAPEAADMGAEGADMAAEEAKEEVAEDIEDEVGEGEEAEEEAEALDLAPLTESMGVTEERAQMLYDAAQQIPNLEGKTPQELADMIAADFDVLMQLEMVAARGEGGAMDAPPAEGMMPAGPQGMPPGQMMPPEGM